MERGARHTEHGPGRRRAPRPSGARVAGLLHRAAAYLVAVLAVCLARIDAGHAQTVAPTPAAPPRLKVAAPEGLPPFSYRDSAGVWQGLSVSLWTTAAADLNVTYDFVPMETEIQTEGIATGEFDVVIGPVSISSTREPIADFTVPYFVSGVVIAVPNSPRAFISILLENLQSPVVIQTATGLVLLLAGFGAVFWVMERRRNPEFGGTHLQGWGSGVWLAFVTMTTVGYGDKAPKTIGGRLAAGVWMLISLAVISGVAGVVASVLTLGRLDARVRDVRDLQHVRVVTVADTNAAAFLRGRGIHATEVPDIHTAMDDLLNGRAEAFVYDRAVLLAALARHPKPITVLPGAYSVDFYAFALPPNSPLRRPLDAAMLRALDSPAWQQTLTQYFGSNAEQL